MRRRLSRRWGNASFGRWEQPPPPKRRRRNTHGTEIEAPTHRETMSTSSAPSSQEREPHLEILHERKPIPMQGNLIMQTRGLHIFYCAVFSQLLLAGPPNQTRKENTPGHTRKKPMVNGSHTRRMSFSLSSRECGIYRGTISRISLQSVFQIGPRHLCRFAAVPGWSGLQSYPRRWGHNLSRTFSIAIPRTALSLGKVVKLRRPATWCIDKPNAAVYMSPDPFSGNRLSRNIKDQLDIGSIHVWPNNRGLHVRPSLQ